MNETNNNLGLDETTVDPDPIDQFKLWFQDAIDAGLPLPESMTVATTDAENRPHARILLLKEVDDEGFVFFTNYRSAKVQQIEFNPYVALCFHWAPLERQVRIEGAVNRISREESVEYFKTRPRESQLGAWVSPQSEVITSRESLEQKIAEVEERFRGREVECPENWGGLRLSPERIEFWKGRTGRLHDRLLFEKLTDGAWTIKRLAP